MCLELTMKVPAGTEPPKAHRLMLGDHSRGRL
jgi:hypothetical protein